MLWRFGGTSFCRSSAARGRDLDPLMGHRLCLGMPDSFSFSIETGRGHDISPSLDFDIFKKGTFVIVCERINSFKIKENNRVVNTSLSTYLVS